jgi:DNA-binding NtrC family response regulator
MMQPLRTAQFITGNAPGLGPSLEPAGDEPREELPEIVGSHPAIAAVRRRIPKLAAVRTPLVIVGEAGTGKTLIARHIHRLTGLASPLSIINLAVLPDRDQRLALFGGEPPDFTSTYRGALEEETTVLVKNVDRASAYIRDRLSTCLREGRLKRPGSSVGRPVRCRAIFTMSQTPRRLMRLCKSDTSVSLVFRHLPVIALPPLSRRRADLPALVGSLMLRQHQMRSALQHSLPDNLHDLLALLDVVCPPGAVSALEDQERRAFARIQRAITEGREFSLRSAMGSLEATLARRALDSVEKCRQAVARRLGMSSRTLERMSQATG